MADVRLWLWENKEACVLALVIVGLLIRAIWQPKEGTRLDKVLDVLELVTKRQRKKLEGKK